MGRRKIEIRAIKDDRNRSVTFLKRKGGLFKKAHELSVLCSVDVAVIIFGHNKKLYEFSSGDINETLRRYNYARHGTPQPHIDSRPGSRNTVRRTSSNLVPMTHQQHHTPPAPPPSLQPSQPPQNGYAYVPNPPLYQHNAGAAAAAETVFAGPAARSRIDDDDDVGRIPTAATIGHVWVQKRSATEIKSTNP
ncbi:hypothetical protein DV737_g2666, partial [Chaetothyriales sp. CBS 132003]